MILRNHYETLGINRGAGEDEIRKAYHRLAKLYHPDKNADPKAEEKFKEVGQAYEVMKNKDRREIWEREFARQNTTLREQRTNKETPTRRAESSKTRKPPKTSPKKSTSTDNSKYNFKTGTTESKAKYKFFFTDSDYDSDDDDKLSEKQNKRRQSYAGHEKSSAQWNPPNTDNEKENWNKFDFGFNFYMDTEDGFQTFFDPFHMFYEWQEKPHQFRDFEEDADEFFASFKADCKEKRSQAKKCAGDDGDKEWYDWTRVFNPMDSDDDANDPDRLTCAFCRKQMSAELLRKHESRCRRFSGGPDILAFRIKQAQVETDRRRRSSLQQESKANVQRDELITCMFCYRKFNQKVADRHIDFCAKQTFQTGRPMHPLGKSAAARDYSSKNFTAKEYAKTVPKPKMTPTKRRPSPPQSAEGSRDNNNNTNNTNNGASTSTNPDPKTSDKTKPAAFRKPPKPKLIDVNILPNNGKFSTGAGQTGAFPGDGCSKCQRQYGSSTSRVTCSCGVRKSFSS